MLACIRVEAMAVECLDGCSLIAPSVVRHVCPAAGCRVCSLEERLNDVHTIHYTRWPRAYGCTAAPAGTRGPVSTSSLSFNA